MSASEALAKAESIDGYRAACDASILNSVARENHVYAPSFLEQPEMTRLYKCISLIPLVRKTDVVVMHPSADNGYPHTRPNAIICLPSSAMADNDSLSETLLHEAIHVHQRHYPELWSIACSRDGWTQLSIDQIPTEFVRRCRINPDTMTCPFWAWDKFHVPLPLFIRDDYPTLGGVGIKWLDLRNGALFEEQPTTFTARYGANPPQPEHPYELLAVEYAAAKLKTDDALRTKLQSI
jgi:hypothetical protein